MKIIGLADIHSSNRAVQTVSNEIDKADVTVLIGDITNFGRKTDANQVISPILKQSANVLAVAGNCDYPEVEEYLTQYNINLHGRAVVINNLGFVGLGGSLITPFQTPNELSEAAIEKTLEQGLSQLPASDLPFVLISHQPPFQTKCDRLSSGQHVGSHAVRDFIETQQPLVCLTGHIHEAVSIDHIGQTAVINPGQLQRGNYAWAHVSETRTDCGIGEIK